MENCSQGTYPRQRHAIAATVTPCRDLAKALSSQLQALLAAHRDGDNRDCWCPPCVAAAGISAALPHYMPHLPGIETPRWVGLVNALTRVVCHPAAIADNPVDVQLLCARPILTKVGALAWRLLEELQTVQGDNPNWARLWGLEVLIERLLEDLADEADGDEVARLQRVIGSMLREEVHYAM